ncbi:hypothetical protein P7K49_011350 [Saguinus oedipus]|uniref:Uncharacterized protein n=1 Tax=Saguinus oedipus TaxID=9490 RepID=A0ABQ9VQE8_SAGOE|nr:hypothetical protein P7K49_011350 [Saguinus oedipus]
MIATRILRALTSSGVGSDTGQHLGKSEGQKALKDHGLQKSVGLDAEPVGSAIHWKVQRYWGSKKGLVQEDGRSAHRFAPPAYLVCISQ